MRRIRKTTPIHSAGTLEFCFKVPARVAPLSCETTVDDFTEEELAKVSQVCAIEILRESAARIKTITLDHLETDLFAKCTIRLYQRIPAKSCRKHDVRYIAQRMLMGFS